MPKKDIYRNRIHDSCVQNSDITKMRNAKQKNLEAVMAAEAEQQTHFQKTRKDLICDIDDS